MSRANLERLSRICTLRFAEPLDCPHLWYSLHPNSPETWKGLYLAGSQVHEWCVNLSRPPKRGVISHAKSHWWNISGHKCLGFMFPGQWSVHIGSLVSWGSAGPHCFHVEWHIHFLNDKVSVRAKSHSFPSLLPGSTPTSVLPLPQKIQRQLLNPLSPSISFC